MISPPERICPFQVNCYFATSEDAPDIVRLMNEEAYPGDLSLAFSRTDDPVASLEAENDGSFTVIARDDDGSPIAMCGAIPRPTVEEVIAQLPTIVW